MNYKISNISYQISILLVALFFASPLRAQVIIGNNGVVPRPFSLLELDTTYHKGGLRLPQLTTEQRSHLFDGSTPEEKTAAAQGLAIYNIDNHCIEFWDGAQWENFCDAASFIYFTESGDSRILRDIANPFPADGSETRLLIPHNTPECTTGTPPYTVTVRFGGDYVKTTITNDATGAFDLKLDPNPSDRMRLAILRVTDNCSGKYEDFLVVQDETACTSPDVHAITDLNQTITPGSSVTMKVEATAGTEPLSYQWYWGTSGDVSASLPVGGAQDSIFSTTLSTTGAYHFWCKISNTCQTATSAMFTVTVSCVPAQPGEIIGKSFPHLGATGLTYSVIDVPDVSYNWSLPAGWIQTGGGNANSITVTAGSESGTVSVTPHNSCGDGTPQTLSVKVIKPCGAYISTGVWKKFMCWNLGADEDADPFTPSAGINGDYYQWGYRYPSGLRDVVLGTPTASGEKVYPASRTGAWTSDIPLSQGFYGNGIPDMDTENKSITDPCPDGFRVPNQTEWAGVMNTALNPRTNNPTTAWTTTDNCTDCWSGSMFGDSLFLPAAGYRYYNDGSLRYRGYYGDYWSSTLSLFKTFVTDDKAENPYFTYSDETANSNNSSLRTTGFSIRCIADESTVPQVEITGPEYISIPRTNVPQTYSIDVPAATGYFWSVPDGWKIVSGNGTNSVSIFPATTIQSGGTISVEIALSGGGNTTYTKEIKACGAYTADGVWSNFMCHNMGADETAEPFTPSQDLGGDYYQWGDAMPQGTKDSSTSPWPSAPLSYYGDNTDNPGAKAKSPSDPCPPGYRVPNQDEWNGVMYDAILNPTKPKPETFWVDDDGGYNGDMFGDALFLPAAGYRSNRGNGALTEYNLTGYYWSSTLDPSGAYSVSIDYGSTGDTNSNRALGYSIRCIADLNSCNAAPEQPGDIIGSTMPYTGLSYTYSINPVPGATSYTWTVDQLLGTLSGAPEGQITTPSTSITIIAGNIGGGSTISVTANNACGSSDPSMLDAAVIGRCVAKMSPTVSMIFMCWNLGADESIDPFTPDPGLNGDYYQWGSSSPAGTRDAINGTWSSATPSTSADPCPAGSRLPTQDEWNEVFTYNEVKNVPDFAWSSSASYWSGIMLGDDLFLPAAGYRNSSNGSLTNRGSVGNYWSSLPVDADNASYATFSFSNSGNTNTGPRAMGYSVRCVPSMY